MGLAARQPARARGGVARMPELIVVRCTLWCRAVEFDSHAGFPAPKRGPLGEEACRRLTLPAAACPAGEGGDEI